jgi:Sec-independent protein translocase protein TatA
MLIFGLVAIALLGKRLPSVARSLARSLLEFKNGMNELEGDFRSPIYPESARERQFDRQRIRTATEESAFKLSPLYWPTIKFGVIIQAILGILAALILDMGQARGIFKVAFLAHWLGIFLLLARRPLRPTKADIVFVRWGTPLLMIAILLVAPLVWKFIGETDQNGWQRLWTYWANR